ncbi:DEAD/DEAH box helicase [Tenacibaculum sp. Mcav3-52]|uniref:DEAD/DEAH box helicase n=1 Tax=Tenacibaculum mesophilum TaxID=104268 RepID=A0ABN5T3P5_9FLAO|nr:MULTISPECIES: DEAD/DEAH box helicase [Tenacibaculum]GFD83701.1 DEAD/DEAH box helicase [Tenacibaculum sp. KUL118]AZJ31851.1 DEAD/DEAH box helicase [Tenacibaculum mesophilum]MCG7502162.1 DEAD/DEAH box helicase [Tenacibaculum sp. Mcav3-52]MCO7185808.1 DEAD/DEAH box helicase [Tenacibaculum sp. XPcli2-G]QFS27106.1 DEAD/DEAH box helicase [Tenacibaculum mesophilum]|eukprot:TRINITY_DN3658_c0_g2_i1.p1 TRINITY_DN3658_c0_g2~~TRINITY_DN3658_c0_g2_i1.p1  ORF type:complete len:597 (-),score=125.43 TRINITY_DN3658_c0_g2_i1:18-1808(-)
MSTFLDLGLQEPINKALTDLGYEKPTVIQEKAIPQIISSTEDLKAFAQTGTGKTAAFSLPIIELADQTSTHTQAIILSPTRELAVQIGKNIEDFSKYLPNLKVATVYGGANIEEQIRKLKKGVQIVVGTPGRTVDLIKRRALKLGNVQWLVLDEADEMLNMGFKDELDQVLEATPNTKQTLLFSATFPREVEDIAKNYMTNPVEVTSGQKNQGSDNVSHEYYLVNEKTRYPALKRVADLNPDIYGIVFCRTRRETQEVANNLIRDGYNADSLHGDLSQAQRDSVMEKFRKKNIQILVATDVAARGLDVNNLTHVINHKLPDQIENYNHRSGRTGRAGNKGVSIALVSKKEQGRLRPIERIIKKQFVHTPIPSGKEICQNQLFHLIDKVHNTEVNTEQIEGFLPSIYEKLEDLSREELIQKFVSLEFNTFLSYYENAPDLNNLSSRENSRGRSSSENMTRFFINLGRKDRLNPAKLIGLINDQNIGDKIEIGAIDILDTFSFFEIDKNFEKETLDAFAANDPDFNGRSVNIEITKNDRSGGGRKSRRSGGGFNGKKRRSDKPTDSRKSFGRRRNENNSSRRNDNKPAAGFGRKRRRD